jgi:hypothetical protein
VILEIFNPLLELRKPNYNDMLRKFSTTLPIDIVIRSSQTAYPLIIVFTLSTYSALRKKWVHLSNRMERSMPSEIQPQP